MKNAYSFYILLSIGILSCKTTKIEYNYETNTLKVKQVSKNAFVHISYLETENWGKVGCNGMIVKDNETAIVFDTPVSDEASAELINYILEKLKCDTISVVATHFHGDCLGGLKAFHDRNIPSYATSYTIDLANLNGTESVPQNTIENKKEWKLSTGKIVTEFCGEGHTKDNIVCYFSSEKVLFGGCLVKSIGSGRGNLEDANIDSWSQTIRSVQKKYPKAEVVIPGHGAIGGAELLDYTEQMFK